MNDHDQMPQVAAQPLSKRDKRRTALNERLEDIINSFSENKDQFYREQLGALQLDVALILHAMPYVENPTMEPTAELMQMMHKLSRGDPRIMQQLQEGDMSGIGGKMYQRFAEEVQDAMERRDAALTSYAVSRPFPQHGMQANLTSQAEHKRKLTQLHTTTAFVTKMAEKEHAALSSTVKDRLINAINERKRKLTREMTSNEGIDNSNAHSYNPAQYSVLNPASPGGILGKRSTRHRRDLDDLSSLLDPTKRKRRNMDDSRGSPAPSRREHADVGQIGAGIPLARFTDKAQDPATPLYSVDKLFTEKELSLLERQASEASHKYIIRHKFMEAANLSQPDTDDSRNGEDKDSNDSESDGPLIAPAMDRTTRSTRGIGGATTGFIGSTGIEVIADLTLPTTFTGQVGQMPRLPPPLYASMTKYFNSTKGDNLRPNLTERISDEELNQDINRIQWGKKINSEYGAGKSLDTEVQTEMGVVPGDRRFLAAACAEPGTYPLWLGTRKREEREEAQFGVGKRGMRERILENDESGAVSKQSSRGGSEAGGVEMSREGSRRGRGRVN